MQTGVGRNRSQFILEDRSLKQLLRRFLNVGFDGPSCGGAMTGTKGN